MKINTNQIPFEGISLSKSIPAQTLDLETEVVKFRGPIEVEADITKISNVVAAALVLHSTMCLTCSRCLGEFTVDFEKKIDLNYQIDKAEQIIDLIPDIREEIIVDYPIKPLCKPDCKGLCVKCGNNLNEGICKCISL
ncbi:MAG: DUF177 domain-containing protein [Candidatus Omnitrophota bacterium]